jgi:hypothetical protein
MARVIASMSPAEAGWPSSRSTPQIPVTPSLASPSV